MGPAPFKTGDVVRLKTGNSLMDVYEVQYYEGGENNKYRSSHDRRYKTGWYIRYAYVSSRNIYATDPRKWRRAEDFVHIHQPKEEIKMPQLYQTKEDKPRFGTMLTRDSQNRIVLEMKGPEAGVEAFASSQVEKVMPYTVALTKIGDNNIRHYAMPEGKLEVGDILMHVSNGQLWRVSELNTKRESPTGSKNGFMKLVGEVLGSSADN